MLHTVLRGISRDRLDLLGAEYFQYRLKPELKPHGVAQLNELLESGAEVVLVSQGLDHVMRPLAEHLGVRYLLANRLEFRDGMATGRLLDPVIRPRGALARITGLQPQGRRYRWSASAAISDFAGPDVLVFAVTPARAPRTGQGPPGAVFRARQNRAPAFGAGIARRQARAADRRDRFHREGLAGESADRPARNRQDLSAGAAGSARPPASQRFEKIVEESPVFEPLYRRYGDRLPEFMRERIEVVEGDVSQPGLGMEPAVRERLERTLDVVINSSGLTDFNPDLRDALAANVDSILHLIEFLRQSDHAALLHLSTCYVVGFVDGRVPGNPHAELHAAAHSRLGCRELKCARCGS